MVTLTQATSDPDAQVRRSASAALSLMPTRPEWGAIELMGEDGDAEVRALSMRIASRFFEESASALLTRGATDPNPAVRCAALLGLESLDDRANTDIVNRALTDPHPEVRFHAEQIVSRWQAR